MVEIKLHGELGEKVGSRWDLSVKSVSEAVHAIEIMSGRKLFDYLSENSLDQKYEILINEKEVRLSEELINPIEKTIETSEKLIEKIKESELVIERGNLKTIDIIPVLEGSMGVGAIAAGIITAAAGAMIGGAIGAALLMAGIGLLASGVINLLAKPPEIAEQRDVQTRGATSYLFSDYENTNKEGGPCPVVYGRLLVGSHVIQAAYDTYNIDAESGGEPDLVEDLLKAGIDSGDGMFMLVWAAIATGNYETVTREPQIADPDSGGWIG
jgi:predicted phage tail protein